MCTSVSAAKAIRPLRLETKNLNHTWNWLAWERALLSVFSSAWLVDVAAWLNDVCVDKAVVWGVARENSPCIAHTADQGCWGFVCGTKCPVLLCPTADNPTAGFKWACSQIKWGGNVMSCLCHSIEREKKNTIPSFSQMCFCGNLIPIVIWAGFAKLMTRTFCLNASRRKSPVVLVLASRARFGSHGHFSATPVGRSSVAQGSPAGSYPAVSPPLWHAGVAYGLRICHLSWCPCGYFVYNSLWWGSLRPRQIHPSWRRGPPKPRRFQADLGKRVSLPPPLPPSQSVGDWTVWLSWRQPLSTASASKSRGLEVRPLAELELDTGDEYPAALPDPLTQAPEDWTGLYFPEDGNLEGKRDLCWPSLLTDQTSGNVSELQLV